MVSWFSKWAQGIIVAVVIATLIELILPNGSSKKYVKVIIGIYILFTIISPVIVKSKGGNLNMDEVLDTQKYEEKISKSDNKIYAELEANNSRTIKDIYISSLTEDIKSKLKAKGYQVISTNIKIEDNENYTIESISLNLSKEENEENEGNSSGGINIETVEIKGNNTNNNINESNNTLTESQKNEIKVYLSEMYDIDIRSIYIS